MKEVRFEATEIRRVTNDDKKSIGGYAAVFGKLSQDLGGFREKIAPGAFAESLKNRDVRALWSHNTDLVLGRTGNGSLVLTEDGTGLGFNLELPDTTTGRDAFALVSRGDVGGVSFGFRVLPEGDSWAYENDGTIIRTLTNVDLLEISPTAFPAYPQTEVSTRSSSDVLKRGLEVLQATRPELRTPFNLLRAKIELARIAGR